MVLYFALLYFVDRLPNMKNNLSFKLFYCLTLLLKFFSVRYLIQNLTCTFSCNWVLPVLTAVPGVTLLIHFKEEKGKETFVFFEGAFNLSCRYLLLI